MFGTIAYACLRRGEATADGLEYARTGFNCLCNKSWKNIDGGVAVDLNIPNVNDKNEFDASKYYDYVTITNFLKSAK